MSLSLACTSLTRGVNDDLTTISGDHVPLRDERMPSRSREYVRFVVTRLVDPLGVPRVYADFSLVVAWCYVMQRLCLPLFIITGMLLRS